MIADLNFKACISCLPFYLGKPWHTTKVYRIFWQYQPEGSTFIKVLTWLNIEFCHKMRERNNYYLFWQSYIWYIIPLYMILCYIYINHWYSLWLKAIKAMLSAFCFGNFLKCFSQDDLAAVFLLTLPFRSSKVWSRNGLDNR